MRETAMGILTMTFPLSMSLTARSIGILDEFI